MLREFWKSFRHKPEPAKEAEHAPIRRRVEHLRVRVGLDFGTSATKATYRVLGAANPYVRSLLFHHNSARYPIFCIPSLGALSKRGELTLGIEADAELTNEPWGEGLTRFKMLVAGDQDSRYLDEQLRERFRSYLKRKLGSEAAFSPEALAATYIAYAMRLVSQELRREVQASSLDLSFNTCVPIDQRENSLVFAAFQRVVATAEHLDKTMPDGQPPGIKWIEAAAGFLGTARYDETDPSTRVFLVPEAVASVAAYLVSLQRRLGLHALYDIGSGTTDLSIFRLKQPRNGEATNYWYAARSIPRGTGQIEERIAKTVSLAHLGGGDLLSAVMENGATAAQTKTIEEELGAIWKRTSKGWSEAYGHLSTEAEWRGDKVDVFLAGGGALLPTADAVFQECPLMPRWGPYECKMLPTPDGFDDRGGHAPFGRMSVAYGLSIPIPELPVNVMPSESPDHTPPRFGHSDLYSINEDEGPT